MSDEFNPHSLDACLSAINVKLDNLDKKMDDHHTEFITKIKEHDEAINKLNEGRWKQLLMMAGLGTGTGGAGHFIGKLLDHNK